MKQILLLFSEHAIASKAAEPERLVTLLDAEAKRAGHDEVHTTFAVYENLVHIVSAEAAAIIDTATGADIAEADLVYQRRWHSVPDQAKACATYLGKKGVPALDREAYATASKNKLTQMWQLWENNLPIPPTAYAAGAPAFAWLLAHMEQLPFGFPMVVKSVSGTRGEDNYFVESLEELRTVAARQPGVVFLLQAFIKNRGDYRVIVCGDEARLVLHRVAPAGSHTNNTSQGGSAALVEVKDLPREVIDDCIRAANIFGREFAGVDVVISSADNAHYFFEVNRSPQVESGSFVEEKAAVLANYLYERMSA